MTLRPVQPTVPPPSPEYQKLNEQLAHLQSSTGSLAQSHTALKIEVLAQIDGLGVKIDSLQGQVWLLRKISELLEPKTTLIYDANIKLPWTAFKSSHPGRLTEFVAQGNSNDMTLEIWRDGDIAFEASWSQLNSFNGLLASITADTDSAGNNIFNVKNLSWKKSMRFRVAGSATLLAVFLNYDEFDVGKKKDEGAGN